MQRFVIALAISVLTFGVSASAASLDDIDPHMRKDAECMLGVLRTVPGIDQVELGVWQPPKEKAVPYLQYRAVADKDGYRLIVRFTAETGRTRDGKASYYFTAVMNGLVAGGEPGPREGGASAIERRWKADCGVEANMLFV